MANVRGICELNHEVSGSTSARLLYFVQLQPKKSKNERSGKYTDSIYTENTTECFMQIHIASARPLVVLDRILTSKGTDDTCHKSVELGAPH